MISHPSHKFATFAVAALTLSVGHICADDDVDASSTDSPKPSEANSSDMIRFANHDTLHGKFIGFGASDTIQFKSPEAQEAIPFSTTKLQRIVLNKGKGYKNIPQLSSVQLTNGDVIPGTIKEFSSANPKQLTLETEHMGTIQIPMSAVSKIAANPHGGPLLYYGPLNADGWEIQPLVKPEEKKKEAKEEGADDKKDAEEKKESSWKHIGCAWYAGAAQREYLVRKNALPDVCKLSLKVGWQRSLYCNIVLHADFAPPEFKGDDKSSVASHAASIVGHCYVLSISSSSASISSYTFGDDGKPKTNRIENSYVSTRLSGDEEAYIELRLDRPKKFIMLYINGEFKTKWNLGDDYAGKGNHLAFSNPSRSRSALRISDVVITPWNGMKDSAASTHAPDRDIILLTNGLDRFSGKLNSIKDGQVKFSGTYNNVMTIPIEKVQEINLARKANNKDEATPDEEEVADKNVHFSILPHGKISGIPSMSTDGITKITSPLLGELELDTRYVNIIDFSNQNSLLEFWDDNF